MSASASDDNFELNLTPLLDMILQLIMFFMMCVNFVAEQVNANVLLPTSNSAQEIQAKSETSMLVINIEVERVDKRDASGNVVRNTLDGKPIREVKIDEHGRRTTKILFASIQPITFTDDREGPGLVAAQRELKNQAHIYRQTEARRLRKNEKDIEVKIPVIIRADAETRYGLVVLLMAQCVKEGYPKVELRALTNTSQ